MPQSWDYWKAFLLDYWFARANSIYLLNSTYLAVMGVPTNTKEKGAGFPQGSDTPTWRPWQQRCRSETCAASTRAPESTVIAMDEVASFATAEMVPTQKGGLCRKSIQVGMQNMVGKDECRLRSCVKMLSYSHYMSLWFLGTLVFDGSW